MNLLKSEPINQNRNENSLQIKQVAPQSLDLHLNVTPNAPYHMEVSDSLDPGSSWTYLGPFSSSTSDYVYHHNTVGNLPPQQFFRAVSP